MLLRRCAEQHCALTCVLMVNSLICLRRWVTVLEDSACCGCWLAEVRSFSFSSLSSAISWASEARVRSVCCSSCSLIFAHNKTPSVLAAN